MKSMVQFIPNSITALNLVCGFLAIYFWHNWAFEEMAYCILAAAIFDFSDGLAARIFNAHSAMGKELDSLADMVTFGVVPGLAAFALVEENFGTTAGLCSGITIAVLSALRLARFNSSGVSTIYFRGIPTPMYAMCWALLLFERSSAFTLSSVFGDSLNSTYPGLFIVLLVVLSVCLWIPIPFFSLKFKSISWLALMPILIFLVSGVLVLVLIGLSGAPILLVAYGLSSFTLWPCERGK
jgi:CDP-diacylglycerol--serine O-phosphatidyltransferase